MKVSTLLLTFMALGMFALVGRASLGGDTPAADISSLLTEVVAQQKTIAENHAKIDEKLAAINEELRQAKIYVSRGGAKSK